MPEYTWACDGCCAATENRLFTVVCSISEYDEVAETLICPVCGSNDISREYAEDSVSSHYVNGLSECKTLGHYAEKQSQLYGKEKCEKMQEGFMEYRKNKQGGMKQLPTGMTRMTDPTDMPLPNTKESIKKKRGY